MSTTVCANLDSAMCTTFTGKCLEIYTTGIPLQEYFVMRSLEVSLQIPNSLSGTAKFYKLSYLDLSLLPPTTLAF